MEKDETSSLLLHLFQVPNPKMTINNKSMQGWKIEKVRIWNPFIIDDKLTHIYLPWNKEK